jgi:hypothetical protein
LPQDIPQVDPQTPPGALPKAGGWTRFKGFVTLVDSEFSFVKGLSLVTIISGLAGGYFQYVTAYQDKVKTAATQQITAAETTYADISTMFSKAITLQQYLFFDYRDSVKSNADGDDHAIYAKNAHAIFQPYDDLRISLRENIDLLARKVEKDLDWNSNTLRDAAKVKTIGTDKVTRLALGHYDFACESDKYMPSFNQPAAVRRYAQGKSQGRAALSRLVQRQAPVAGALLLFRGSAPPHRRTTRMGLKQHCRSRRQRRIQP